jgi:GNAT superfamily N-acetyltransferase
MKNVTESVLTGDNDVIIRNYEPADVEYVIKRHRELYEGEMNYSSVFGDYVEKYVVEFDKSHDQAMENMWIAEVNGRQIGVIAIVKVDENTAQLRWFLVEPSMRGKGIGHILMKTVIDFCKDKKYNQVILWTVNILPAARHLYKAYGFELVESVENDTWTKDVINEERWDLNLRN